VAARSHRGDVSKRNARDRLGTIDVVATKILHVLWSPQSGPLCAYWNPAKAWTHARTMLGVEVASIELRVDLPEIVKDDIENELFSEDDTPDMNKAVRTKTTKMLPLEVEELASLTKPAPSIKPRAEPLVAAPPDPPVVPRAATRSRVALPPLPHPPSVELKVEELDENETSLVPPTTDNPDDEEF
jgi:hypothetical protein